MSTTIATDDANRTANPTEDWRIKVRDVTVGITIGALISTLAMIGVDAAQSGIPLAIALTGTGTATCIVTIILEEQLRRRARQKTRMIPGGKAHEHEASQAHGGGGDTASVGRSAPEPSQV